MFMNNNNYYYYKNRWEWERVGRRGIYFKEWEEV